MILVSIGWRVQFILAQKLHLSITALVHFDYKFPASVKQHAFLLIQRVVQTYLLQNALELLLNRPK